MDKTVAMRPRRIRNAPRVYTPSKNDTNTKYKLDKQKAIKKKYDTTLRMQDVDIQMKSGTLVLTFSAAAFEVFKTSMFQYFKDIETKHIDINSKTSETKEGDIGIVDQSISVKRDKQSGQLYRINVFYTTSRVDANGRELAEFVNVDLPVIIERMFTVKDLRAMNDRIRNVCKDYLRKSVVSSDETRQGVQKRVAFTENVDSNTAKSVMVTNIGERGDSGLKCIEARSTASVDIGTRVETSDHNRSVDDSNISQNVVCTGSSSKAVDDRSVKVVKDSIVKKGASVRCSDVQNVRSVQDCTNKHLSSNANTDRCSASSIAVDLLEEEKETMCMVCSSSEQSENNNMCDICSNSCHDKCAVIDTAKGTVTCLSCAAINEQRERQKENEPTQVHISEESTQSQQNSESKTIQKKQQKGKGEDTNTVKLSEIRQKELKLKKWEEELKVREAKLVNAEKDRVRLQTYVTKVEAHNNELEQSLRILKRRLAMLEEKENTVEDRFHSENVNSQNGDTVGDKNGIQNSGRKDKTDSSIHTLVGKIHDRVSDYILRKIDSELSNL